MSAKNILSMSFFRLPFNPNTRILTQETLNCHSEIRKPKRTYFPIKIRKISYTNELLTLGVTLVKEDEELVYIKVTSSALFVSCSVDTHESYLSRYAYYSLFQLIFYYGKYDFEQYYWPGFFDEEIGLSKYLRINKSKGSLWVSVKLRYKTLYKPGQNLLMVSTQLEEPRKALPIIHEESPKDSDEVLGFCLADCSTDTFSTNHYPFLIPYIGTLTKEKKHIRAFTTYVLNELQLLNIDLDADERDLVEICFEMKKVASIAGPKHMENSLCRAERLKQNKNNFNQLFELWKKAFPLLLGRLFIHYCYTYGMRNLKGKPMRSYMMPCSFDSAVPEIYFLWKDMGDYYKLELQLMPWRKIDQMKYLYRSAFFAMRSFDPKIFTLLSSIRDIELFTFFQERHFQISVLKKHYDCNFKDFVDRLRSVYRFIDK